MTKLRHFSGTPVSEGVRLEVGKYTVFAVRNETDDIAVRMRREPRRMIRALLRVPFLRGVARLFRDVCRFFDGIGESAELRPKRAARGTRPERALADFLNVTPQSVVTAFSLLALPILAFVLLYAAPKGFELFLSVSFALSRAWVNAIVCAVRVLSALLAIFCATHLRVFNRLLMYQGAINQLINCYEDRAPISAENAAKYSRATRRSESGFLIGVMIISIILFALVRTRGVWLTLALRAGILLGVAAVFNEPYLALESAEPTLPVRVMRAPIALIQHMTTLEPQPGVMEVALCAFQAALGENGEEENP